MNYDGVVHVFVLSFYIILYPQILSARICVYTVAAGADGAQQKWCRSSHQTGTDMPGTDSADDEAEFHQNLF